MNKKEVFFGIVLLFFAFTLWSFYPQKNDTNDFSERVKIALREVGNQLLLSEGDSTSLILPVKRILENKFEISFENKLGFEPDQLVNFLKVSVNKSSLSKNYRVEVLQCFDNEVAYSYEINIDEEKTLIPCSGRFLPKKCYLIQVHFLDSRALKNKTLYYIFIPLILVFFYWQSFIKKKKKYLENKNLQKHKTLGSFMFYPEQNKLVKKAKEIALSKKECELLEIFITNANKVVKREELTKRVWENNGVIVGRSLDTYISKLRKKLKEDSSIKLINIHGVGYKLEIKE
ncbi:winged helix-turn-helix domain-containing protein [Polaribacter porphyrae]|uniref:Transcriptional regulator n=1 Tax=Polaribacter porphyrae TaxID=1137780 RepID=A0A2S7WRB7_9FLAO|nr:winged helix-turn-helix domain-containing protein [Polaribacter porphyrae]PQJ80139.1 transcriptional regulator [Polaribacter porphyrae]